MTTDQHIVLSYSRVDTWRQCQYRYKLRYIDTIVSIDNCDPDDPRINGIAIHHIAQMAQEEAIDKETKNEL